MTQHPPAAPHLLPQHLSVRDAAQYIGVSRSRFYELLRDGSILARKLGNRTLIALSDLNAFLARLPAAEFRPLRTKGRRA